MFSILNALVCAVLAIVVWTGIGFPIARITMPRMLALPLAPMLGWAVHSAVLLPVFSVVGMSRASLIAAFALALLVVLLATRQDKPFNLAQSDRLRIPVLAFVAAGLFSIIPMMAIVPKISADGFALAAPIFDHSKIAIIDEISRLGVPAGNPFFAEIGGPARLSYYYLWHFSAAELALLTGSSGWEADAGLTCFTGFASLALMMGFALWFSRHALSALLVIVLAASGSVRPTLSWLIGQDNAYAVMGWPTGLGGWLFQVTWAPQHAASAACVVLAVYLMTRLARQQTVLLTTVLMLVVVAGYESSAWLGGVTFAIAAVVTALLLFVMIAPDQRWRFVVALVSAGAGALLIASPFLYEQIVATAQRQSGSPIAIMPFRFFTSAIPLWIRTVFDLPAYWLVFLPLMFPAIYLTGGAALIGMVRDRSLSAGTSLAAVAFGGLIFVSFGVNWFLVSAIGDNNDLGWRAVLPALILLNALAAAGVARWLKQPKTWAVVASAFGILVGLQDNFEFVRGNIVAQPTASAIAFGQAADMWQAVRRHSGPDERIASNPNFLADMTPWPVNISWALLSDRRSCFAGPELALPFASVSAARRAEIDAQFTRIFDGETAPGDLQQLVARYGCHVVVLTWQDKAWTHDPFADNAAFHLVESGPALWRIYRKE